MNRILFFLSFLLFIFGCSFNKNSKFWTKSEKIKDKNNINFEVIFPKEEALKKEFNSNLKVNLNSKTFEKTFINNFQNNNGRLKFNGSLKKSSRYRFSKIKDFYSYKQKISFFKKNVIFFDNKGTILQFNENLN